MGVRNAGWYADPITVGAARYWDGHAWTQQVAWGGQVRTDPTPLAEVARRDDDARSAVVADYLADVERRHVVGPLAIDALRRDHELHRSPSTSAPPSVAAPPAPVRPAPVAPTPRLAPTPQPAPTSQPAPPTNRPVPPTRLAAPIASAPSAPAAARAETPAVAGPAPAPVPTLRAPEPVTTIPSEPGHLARWWGDVHRAVRSDLALHGLAYLGVLLLFAGVTGLIIFSFGDVSPWLRPLAELLVPVALFVSAWYLDRRSATIVAASLTFLGGAITPIVVAASLTDGFDVPPDLSGPSLPIVQGLAVALIGGIYGLVAFRRPASPLRHLAAPVLWMASGILAGAWRDPVPAGYDTVRADSLQLAVVLTAIAVTLGACTWRAVPSALASTTRRTALPVAAVVVVLEMILSGSEGWPLASTVVVTLAALAVTELLADRLTPVGTSIAQMVVVGIAAGRLAAVAAPAWVAVGAAVGLLGLVEYQGRRRPAILATAAGLGASGIAFLLTLAEPAPAAVAFGILTVWGLWRHVEPAAWLPVHDRAGFVPAGAATATTVALWDLSDRGPALVATGAAVLAITLVARYWRPDDLLWRWFPPAAAGTVVLVSMAFPWGESPIEVAAATGLATAAILASRLPSALRTWASAGTVVWALANVAEELDVAPSVQATVLGALALLLVVGAVVTARPLGVHLATIGHLAGLGALTATTWPGWGAAVAVAMATTGWLVVTVVDERGEAVHLAALRRVLSFGTIEGADQHDGERVPDPTYGAVDAIPVVEQVPPLLTFGGMLATVVLALDASGQLPAGDPWIAVIVGALAAGAAAVVRAVPWRRAQPKFLAWVTLLVAAFAAVIVAADVGADRGDWAPIAAMALVLLVVALTAPPRPLAFAWVGWAGGGTLALFVVDRLGLDRDLADVATAAWGATALLGGLAVYRRRHGPVVSTALASEPLLLPPVVLGAAAFVVGGLLGLSAGTEAEIGWTSSGLALVVLAVALLIPLGAIVALAEVLGTVAYTLLAPWDPLDRPWAFAPWVAGLVVIALATNRTSRWDVGDPDTRLWDPRRWDLPSFLVAHGVAAVALATAHGTGTVVSTYLIFGVMSLALAVVLGAWPWAAGGAVLVLVAAADAGHGWLALVLLVDGVALTVVGLLRTSREQRLVLIGFGAAALVGAWFDLATWLQWSDGTLFLATMPAAAALALVAAVALRTRRVPMELAAVWTIVGSTLAISISGLVEAAGRRPGGLTMGGSWLLLAAVAATTAVLVAGVLRWVAVAFVAAAWLSLRWALEPSDLVVVLVATGVALATTALLGAARRRWSDGAWLLPAAGHGVFMQVGAATVATVAQPDAALMVIVLLAIGVELTALGLLLAAERRWALLALGAASLVGAWFETTDWLGWSWETVFVVTAPAAAMVAMLAATALRARLLPDELTGVYAVAGTLVAIGTSASVDAVARRPGGLAMAAALLLLAATAAMLAPVLSGLLRWVTSGLIVAAAAAVRWAMQPADAVTALVGTGLALVVLVAALAVHGRRPGEPWLLPWTAVAAAAQVAAGLAATVALPETAWLVVVLLAVGAELVAMGVLLTRPALFVVAPAAACAAWIVYAQEVLRGNANWFTVPIGVTVLVMVGLLRWIRSWRGGAVAGWDVVALELVGMSFLVASPLALTLGGQLWNGVLAIVVGVLIAGWGAATRVRWRAGFGAGSVVLAVVLLIGVPLSDAVTWRGPALWIVLSVVGIAAIVAASAIESSRDRLRQLAVRLDEMTDGWERIPLHRDESPDDQRHFPPPTAASGSFGGTAS